MTKIIKAKNINDKVAIQWLYKIHKLLLDTSTIYGISEEFKERIKSIEENFAKELMSIHL